MNRKLLALSAALLLLLAPLPAMAWDEIGHRVTARIAWEHLRPDVRRQVAELMLDAPPESELATFFPSGGALSLRRQRLFVSASTWPDFVRSGPAARRRFHHRDWHFINFFWQQPAGGRPEELNDREPEPRGENILERLGAFNRSVNGQGPGRDRAVELAWMLHLIGDIHQPLHTSARVTDLERDGDHGGNDFKVERGRDPLSLHSYWDGIVSRSFRRNRNESEDAYVDRIAAEIMRIHPISSMEPQLKPGRFEEWAREGLALAMAEVYTSDLTRGVPPTAQYRRRAYTVARPRIALAGYRMADTMNRLFGR